MLAAAPQHIAYGVPIDHLGHALALLLGQGLAIGLEGGLDNSDLRPVAACLRCISRRLLCEAHEAHLQRATHRVSSMPTWCELI